MKQKVRKAAAERRSATRSAQEGCQTDARGGHGPRTRIMTFPTRWISASRERTSSPLRSAFRGRGEGLSSTRSRRPSPRSRNGSFGVCEECSEEISQEAARGAPPETTLCIRCKEDQERMEKDFVPVHAGFVCSSPGYPGAEQRSPLARVRARNRFVASLRRRQLCALLPGCRAVVANAREETSFQVLPGVRAPRSPRPARASPRRRSRPPFLPSGPSRRSTNPVGAGDDVEVVLDDDDRVSPVAQIGERDERAPRSSSVVPRRRLVEDVEASDLSPCGRARARSALRLRPPESVVAGWPRVR